MGGLTRVILTVLGMVNLRFQGRFVFISLRPVLGSVWQLMSWPQPGHHVANFFHLIGVSVSINTGVLTRHGTEYYL